MEFLSKIRWLTVRWLSGEATHVPKPRTPISSARTAG